MTEKPLFEESGLDEKTIHAKSKVSMLTIGCFSIVMFFAGLTSAYIVSSSDGYWVIMKMPLAFWLSTIFILCSSATIYMTQRAIKQNKLGTVKIGIVATLVLGIAFTITQFQGYDVLLESGNAVRSRVIDIEGTYGVDYSVRIGDTELAYYEQNFYYPEDIMHTRSITDSVITETNRTAPYIYLLTFLHLIHLAFGIIALIVMTVKAFGERYSSEDYLGIRLGARYWHFLGGLWVYLFLFLYLFH